MGVWPFDYTMFINLIVAIALPIIGLLLPMIPDLF